MDENEYDIALVGRRLYAALDAQDWSRLDGLVSPGLVVQVGSGSAMGLAQWRRNQEAFYRGFPDGRHVIEDILIDHERCVTRCRFTGTHSGSFVDLAPTGKTVSVGVIHIDRFDKGRLVEHYGQLDMHGLLQQLEAV
ncbi:ester cyclase [Nocardia sp. NPDC004568]|uniref:ester cyclase n=1 Tax=Nocardia sp. NPDC004568 TaxID=3154551 RepID=UPI0033B898DF